MRTRLGPILAALGCALLAAEASAAPLGPAAAQASALPESHVGLLILAAAALYLGRWD
jgi:hypothetical protein